jgi:hypothetical protein
MATKKNSKKLPKKDPLAYQKAYLLNIVNHLDMCAKHNGSGDLGAYFQRKADLNREKLKGLK